MARSRNIKPGFFTNDELAELPALTRLLFIGLWTLVDRDGRIEDRPKKIKAECMPYDDMDADAALSALCRSGFILRYEADNTRCIQVLNWHKHQNPHVKELASTLPAPDKHQTSTVLEPVKPQPQPEPARLIPDSLPLIPDSLECPPASRVPPADAGSKPRASKRCPESFAPSEDMRQWAMVEAPRADFSRELAKFRDYTFKTAHSDWPAAFRNWLRKASDDANKRPVSFQAQREAEAAKWFKGTTLDPSTQQDYIDAVPLAIR